jgi:hypothetical protein
MKYNSKDFENQQGIALIATLLFMLALGVLSTALVFTVQNEMKSSAAYKYSQQSFYVANAGVQKAVQWYGNEATYAPHLPATDYDIARLPVGYSGSDVKLAGTGSSVYPQSSVISTFAGQFSNVALAANGQNSGVYSVQSTLLKYKPANFINPATLITYASATERWRIRSTGYWGTVGNPMGIAQITAVIENSGNALFDKALWGIDWVNLGGTVLIDSYDPALGAYGGTNIGSNGSVGSNGYITANGNVEVKGDVAYYDATNSTITQQYVTGQIIHLQEQRTFPPIPNFSVGATNITKNSTGTTTINPGSYGDINIKKGTLLLNPGTYYFNSITDSANGSLAIGGGSDTTIFVKTALDLGGSGVINSSGDPTKLTIYYRGTGEMKVHGNPAAFLEVYAPNAPLKFVGTSDFWGSFIGKTATVMGTPEIHFDEGCLNDNLIQRQFRIISWSQDTY